MSRKYTLQNRGQLSLNKYGKTVRKMSDDERREYMRIKKAESRKRPDIKQREKIRNSQYYYNNIEKFAERRKLYYNMNRDKLLQNNRVENPWGNCLPIQMFGCHEKEMTPEQKRLLNNKRCNNYYHRVLKYKLYKTGA